VSANFRKNLQKKKGEKKRKETFEVLECAKRGWPNVLGTEYTDE